MARPPLGGGSQFRPAKGMSKKSPQLTPLQLEQRRKEEEAKRRQQAALNAIALRQQLVKAKARRSNSSSEPEPANQEPAPPDFDLMRKALEKERHKAASRNGRT